MTQSSPASPLSIPPIVTEIAKRATLRTLNLARCSCDLMAAVPGGKVIESLQMGLRGGGRKHPLPRTFECGFGLDLSVHVGGINGPVARFSCDYAGIYEISDQAFFDGLTDHEFSVFAGFNFSFHVWPFARELVHSLASKMALPPVVLPLFRTGEMIPPPEKWKLDATEGTS